MVDKLAIDEIRKILQFISKGYKVPDIIYDTIKKVAIREVEDKNRVILAKRDPDIGNGRIQAMYVKIIDGYVIEFYPPAVVGFGADFDGDSVSVLVPLSKEAQEEAKNKMVKATSNEGINSQNFEISKEMLVGIYVLTEKDNGGSYRKVSTFDDLYKMDVGDRVEIKFKNSTRNTTAGRIIFNNLLPPFIKFHDSVITKKELKSIMLEVIQVDKQYYADTVDKIVKASFYYATIYPQTMSIDMLKIGKPLQELKDKLTKSDNIDEQSQILEQMNSVMMDQLKKESPDLYAYVKSGASKGEDQVRQILVSKGLIQDPSGNILPPIYNSIADGYTTDEYFNASAGARAGLISKALGTAQGGYEYRKSIYVVGDVKADINIVDCGTKDTLNIKLSKDIFKRLTGRFMLDEKNKIVPVNESYIGKIIRLRSPIYCQSRYVCRTCYGLLLKQLNSQNIGIIASQEVCSLAEKFMKSFHTGGAVKFDKVDIQRELLVNVDDSALSIIKINTYQNEGVENILYAKEDGVSIYIDSNLYDIPYKIEEDDDGYIIPIGIFDLKFGDTLTIPVSISREIKIYKSNNVEGNLKTNITIKYNKNDKLFYASSKSVDYSDATKKLDEMISGKLPTRNIPILYGSFYRTMSPIGSWDSVHLEVLISNCLRWSVDPQVPARLKRPFDPQMFPIKQLPSIISWPLGLAFENMSSSLQYGLISDRGETSEIEKVILGEPLSDITKKKK